MNTETYQDAIDILYARVDELRAENKYQSERDCEKLLYAIRLLEAETEIVRV